MKTIPLSQLEADPRRTLNEIADSGQGLVVELPGHGRVAIQPIDEGEDDTLLSDLLERNPSFQELVSKSASGSRKPFTPGG